MARNDLSLKVLHNVSCLIALVGVIALQSFVLAQESPKPASPDPLIISREDRLKVFENLWETVNKKYFDPQFNGINWAQMKNTYRPQVAAAKNKNQLRNVLQKMLDELHTSHLQVRLHAQIDPERIAQDLSRRAGRKENLDWYPGLDFTRVEGRAVVSYIADGSGAQLAGVQRGWILTHWNGEPYRGNSEIICDLGEKLISGLTICRDRKETSMWSANSIQYHSTCQKEALVCWTAGRSICALRNLCRAPMAGWQTRWREMVRLRPSSLTCAAIPGG